MKPRLHRLPGRAFKFFGANWRGILAGATAGFWGFLTLAFFGSMIWAVSKDPFKRDWFTLRTENYGKVEGVAVLPKPVRPMPVVFFVYGAGGSMITSGNYVRQLAELGVASVVLEYDAGTDQRIFNEQFAALREYVAGQPWARLDRTAWIGFSRGAQQTGAFLAEHPEAAPRLYVRVGGGEFVVGEALTKSPLERILLVHGENDAIFPLKIAEEARDTAEAAGIPVDLRVLPGQGHAFGMERHVVIRAIGEYTKAFLTPNDPLPTLPVTKDYWYALCVAPAFLWGLFWVYWRYFEPGSSRLFAEMNQQDGCTAVGMPSSRLLAEERQDAACTPLWEKALRCSAAILATLAMAQTALHLGTPRLAVSAGTLGIGREWLIPDKWREDFDTIAYEPYWRGEHRLKTLLTHVELSNYCVYELINWEMGKEIYNRYVLSPIIGDEDRAATAELNWRRPLWEFFYPRIRKEDYTEHAAGIIVRNLRERVTVVSGEVPDGIETIWRDQLADESGFERIYVAALRSAGVPARLDERNEAEFWTGTEWKSAPGPAITVWPNPADTLDRSRAGTFLLK